MSKLSQKLGLSIGSDLLLWGPVRFGIRYMQYQADVIKITGETTVPPNYQRPRQIEGCKTTLL